jgi:protein-S-isoprenylcysteine O-methyltransferase Ste14
MISGFGMYLTVIGVLFRASMDPLYKKAIAQGIAGMAVFVAFIFVPAGTWHYWQGWLFIAVFSASTVAFTVYLALYDRPLLERRMNAGPQHEKEDSQKIIVSLIIFAFFVFLVLPPLDYRVGLSPVPAYLSFIGDILIVSSFLFIFWVLRVNSFAAANISVADDHRVIDTGPYAYVRHPMYAGALWLFIGVPLALGSWLTICLLPLILPLLVWRLLDEERILRRDLPGYNEYASRVRQRLIPYIW